MAIAALILGIVGGLFELLLAIAGYGIASIAGAGGATGTDFFKLVMMIIPIASLAGGGMSLAKPLFGGVLMLVSAVLVLIIFGFNFFTFLSIALSGIGGILALVSSQHSSTAGARSGDARHL